MDMDMDMDNVHKQNQTRIETYNPKTKTVAA